MSFILDALRKSESQRRLESVPEVMRVPIAVKRERVPRWALGMIVTLTLALIAVTLVGLRTRPDAAPRADAAPEPAATSLAESAPPEPSAAPVPSRTETPASSSSSDSSAPPRPAQAETALPSRQPGAASVSDAATATGTTAAATSGPTAAALPPERGPALDPVGLPSVAALRAAGVAVPDLELQLLVTSSTPASRFVVVNGNRYREGERLLEGPELVSISDEGAVLRHAGRNFLLVTD